MCFSITFVGSLLSVSGQTQPKQALVRYQLVQHHLPGYDSLRLNLLVTSQECDSLLRCEEQKFDNAFQTAVGSCHANYSPEKNRQLEDSLNALRQRLDESEERFNRFLIGKQSMHDSLLIESFHQRSLEFGKVRSLDLLLDAEPLFSKEPVVDLTNEFILFLQESQQKNW
jgi:hypothetical protein